MQQFSYWETDWSWTFGNLELMNVVDFLDMLTRLCARLDHLHVRQLKCPGACVELVPFDAELLHQCHVQIAERHVFAAVVASVHVAAMLEATSGDHDWEIAV